MTTKTKRYEVIADDDDFDSNGMLKDGKTLRVKMTMMDSDKRAIAHDNDGVPQWAMDKAAQMLGRDSATTVTDADWSRRQEAYNTAELDLANRWRGGVTNLRAGDVVTTSDGHGVVKSHENGRLVIQDASKLDAADAETIKQQAYDGYDRGIQNRWHTRDAEAGGSCTVNGQAGTWRRKDGKLVCCPDQNAREWEMAGPLSDAEAVKVKDAANAQYEQDLVNAWRK